VLLLVLPAAFAWPALVLGPPCLALGAVHLEDWRDPGRRALPGRDLLIIGDDPEDETLLITGSFQHAGDIRIINHGSLIVRGAAAELVLDGSLQVWDWGTFRVEEGLFRLLQGFRYAHELQVLDDGVVEFLGARLEYGGFPAGGQILGGSRVTFRDTTADVQLTSVVAGDARLDVTRSINSMEAILLEGSSVTFTESSGFIVWLGFAEGMTADFSFPDTSGEVTWSFSSDLPGVSGVDYRLAIESCREVLLAMISWPGSAVTVRDSALRACGLYLSGEGSLTFTGLCNNSDYQDYSLPLEDRTLRLVDTRIETWNVYPGGSQELTLNHCLIGELIGYGTSRTTMNFCFIDGSGGYFGVEDQAEVWSVFSSIASDVVVRDFGVLLFLYSSQQLGLFQGAENGFTLIFDAGLWTEPRPSGASRFYIGALSSPVWQAPLDADVPIRGTARILAGPELPLVFERYWLDYGEGEEPSEWTMIGEPHFEPVVDGLLETWDTRGLAPGVYSLRLNIQAADETPVPLAGTILLGHFPTYTPVPAPSATPTPLPTPSPSPLPAGVQVELHLDRSEFRSGDLFRPELRVSNGGESRAVDLYVVLAVGAGYWFWDDWTVEPDYQRRFLDAGVSWSEPLLELRWPAGAGSGSAAFYAAATAAGTFELLGEIDEQEFSWR